MNEPSLFDPDRHVDTVCPVAWCKAMRPAGTERAEDCKHDLELDRGAPRPRHCLNAYDPVHAPWPEGY